MRIYFLALSIQTTVPSPNILCFTIVPVPTSARIRSQSICGFSCFSGLTVYLAEVVSILELALDSGAVLVSVAEIIASLKSVTVACCLE